jgi:hypothetical protein
MRAAYLRPEPPGAGCPPSPARKGPPESAATPVDAANARHADAASARNATLRVKPIEAKTRQASAGGETRSMRQTPDTVEARQRAR